MFDAVTDGFDKFLIVFDFAYAVFGLIDTINDDGVAVRESILSSLQGILTRVQALSTTMDVAFVNLATEIKLNNAKLQLEQELVYLSSMELDYGSYVNALATASSSSNTNNNNNNKKQLQRWIANEYEAQFCRRCNNRVHSVWAIFTYLYGHACETCTALGGYTKKYSHFYDTYLDAARKRDFLISIASVPVLPRSYWQE
jgi:hypothetical protein